MAFKLGRGGRRPGFRFSPWLSTIASFIWLFNNGYKEEAWPRPPKHAPRIVTYFNVDGYRYWVMIAEIEEADLINRAKS